MNPFQHSLIITEDGSPTLESQNFQGRMEKMHHFRGALSETLFIYAPPLKEAFLKIQNPVVFSLGLGLGYNELLATALACKQKCFFQLITCETDEQLTQQILQWLHGQPCKWQAVYEDILQRIAQATEVSPHQIFVMLSSLLKQGSWQIRSSFPESLNKEDQFHVILYDAFSSKMNPQLWSEDFLLRFLEEHTAPTCWLSTYAATGALKRALKFHQFVLEQPPGFGGKRSCTHAYRQKRISRAANLA